MTAGKNNTNLTEQEDSEIRKIFEALLKAAKGKSYFSLHPDRQALTYYETPQHPNGVQYSFMDVSSKETLQKSMEELWTTSDKELLPLVIDLSNLAWRLRETQAEQSTDLSPYVYTLY